MDKITTLVLLALVIYGTCRGQVFDSCGYKLYKPKELHEDLDFLLRKFEEVHPNYFAGVDKDSAYQLYNELKHKINQPMSRLDFLNLFAPTAFNLVEDGHNFYWPPMEEYDQHIGENGKLFPIPILISNGHLYVNSNKCSIPYKSEIISINNTDASIILEEILSHWRTESVDFEELMCSESFNSSYWYHYGEIETFEVRYIESPVNKIKRIILSGLPPKAIDSLRFANNPDNYTFSELPEYKTGIIHYNSCSDLENFRPFCDSVFTIQKTKEYENIVIDVRENLGGTTRMNDILLEYITEKPVSQFEVIETKVSSDRKKYEINIRKKYYNDFKWYNYIYYPIYIRLDKERKKILSAKNGTFVKETFKPKSPKDNELKFNGEIYLLTSSYTYSAAAALASAVKCYGLGKIIGQETGQPTVFTGDWLGVTMPNTNIFVCISFAKFILSCGKNDGHGIIPDYIIQKDIKTFKIEKDEEMDFVLKLIKEQ